jgi:hypothetical protein
LLQNLKNLELNVSKDVEIECYKFVLQTLLPFLRQINDEQMIEKEMEAKLQGIFFHSLSNKLRNSSAVQILLVREQISLVCLDRRAGFSLSGYPED